MLCMLLRCRPMSVTVETVCGNRTSESRCASVSRQNEVSGRLCGAASPLSTEPCTVACPGDCLLSDWSPWSSCSQTCSTGRAADAGFRTRFRHILAVQTDPGSANCNAAFTPDPVAQRNVAHRSVRRRAAARGAVRYLACSKRLLNMCKMADDDDKTCDSIAAGAQITLFTRSVYIIDGEC